MNKSIELSGVRVINLGRTMAALNVGTVMADQGAEVVQIEPPVSRRDDKGIRPSIPLPALKVGGIDARYNYYYRDKKSITLDIESVRGREILYELVKKSDVFIENYRPGVTARRGIDYETLSRINPGIIYCSITGYGPTGPYAQWPGFDNTAQAHCGIMSLTGERDRTPCLVGVPIVDFTTAMFAVQAVTAALYWRLKTGQGRKIETSLLESGASLLFLLVPLYAATGTTPEREGPYFPILALSGAFKTKDGYMVVGVLNQHHWESLCHAIGRDDLLDRPEFKTDAERYRHRKQLQAVVAEALAPRETDYWLELLGSQGVPVGRVNTIETLLKDPQVKHLGLIQKVQGVEGRELEMVRHPVRMNSTIQEVPSRVPSIGEHTAEVLKDVLGYSEEAIEALRKEEVV